MIIRSFLFFSLLLCSTINLAQDRFEKYYPSSSYRVSLIETANGGLAALMSKSQSGSQYIGYFTYDTTGNQLLGRYFGSNIDSEFASDFVQTSDNSYAFIGSGNTLPNGGSDIYFGKFTQQGFLQWQYVFGESITDFGHRIKATSDGGFLLCGVSQAPVGTSWYRSFLIKTDGNGQAEWEKVFHHAGNQEANDVGELPSGHFVAVGYYWNPITLNQDGLVWILGPDGTVVQQIGIGGPGNDIIQRLLITPEGNIIIAGHTDSYSAGEGDVFLAELNSDGELLWSETIGGPRDERGLIDMGLAMDHKGNILVSAYQQEGQFIEQREGILLKTNRIGELLWARWLPGTTQPSEILVLDNGQMVVGGLNFGDSFSSNFIYKMNASGKTSCSSDSLLNFEVNNVQFPVFQDLVYEVTDLNTQNIGPDLNGSYFPSNGFGCMNYCSVFADFSFPAAVIAINDPVLFENNSVNQLNQAWYIEGDSVSNENNLSWNFEQEGRYEIKLIASDTLCADTFFINIQVVGPPEADFDYYQELMVLQFQSTGANAANWIWDFGDGHTSTEANPKHIYDTMGVYEICLTVSNPAGTDTQCQTIHIEVSETYSFAGLEVLTGSTSSSSHREVIRTKDGGYASVGTRYGGAITYGLLIQKYRKDGSIRWSGNISNNNHIDDYGYFIEECHDLGFLVGGEGSGSGSDDAIIIGRTDSVGNLRWDHLIDASGPYNGAYDGVQTSDLGFLVCGQRNSTAFLLKLDQFGNRQWYKEYHDAIRGTSLKINPDSTLFLTANSDIGSILLLHLDLEGNILDSKMLAVDNALITNGRLSERSTFDGSYFISAFSNEGGPKVGLIKIDAAGNMLWNKFFRPEVGNGGQFLSVHETEDQHLFFSVGATYSTGMIMYLDPQGSILWSKRAWFTTATGFGHTCLTYNNRLMITGQILSNSFPSGVMAQIGKDGNLCNTSNFSFEETPTIIFEEPALTDSVRVYSPPAFNSYLIYGIGQREREVLCLDDLSCLPVAQFSIELSSPMVSLTDQSSSANSWLWDFGDGNTSSLQSPTHTYLLGGDYTICLTITDECGSNINCQQVTIYDETCLPTAQFDADTNNLLVDFIDESIEALAWSWDFGDGTSSTEASPSHFYAQNGDYEVCLTVTNACGMNTYCNTVTVFDQTCLPVASFTTFPGDPGYVLFYDLSYAPQSWFWDFGNGNTSTESSPLAFFDQAGAYNVCLTVTNICGEDTDCQMITVDDCTPTAFFDYETFGPSASFIPDSPDGTSWLWEFGDGTSSSEQFASHIYEEEGMFTVCLTISNDCGSQSYCEEILIDFENCLPSAAFVFEQTDLVVSFIAASDNATELLWDFWRWE